MAREQLTDFELHDSSGHPARGDEAYGVGIAREIEETAGRNVLLPAVYAALDRLERNAWVVSTVGDGHAADEPSGSSG